MIQRKVWRTCAGLLGVLLAAAPAAATVVVGAGLGELAREAGVIVRGRVSSVDARWTDDRRGVETLVTLEVERYLKGHLGETVTFRVPGGRVGRLRSIVVGAPRFEPDQQVIVFLGHRGPSIPHVLGLGQGVYRVARHGAGWLVAPPALVGTTVVQPVVRGDRARRPLPLQAFEAQVHSLLQHGDGR